MAPVRPGLGSAIQGGESTPKRKPKGAKQEEPADPVKNIDPMDNNQKSKKKKRQQSRAQPPSGVYS